MYTLMINNTNTIQTIMFFLTSDYVQRNILQLKRKYLKHIRKYHLDISFFFLFLFKTSSNIGK